MRCALLEEAPLPSRKETVRRHANKRYRLTPKGRDLLNQPTVGAQREVLGIELYNAHPYFRRYLDRLREGPLYFPEFQETELERLNVQRDWKALAGEVALRLEASPANQNYDVVDLADELRDFVYRRYASKLWSRRKELLDAVLDAIVASVSRHESLLADPTTLNTLHEWGRQLFLTGSSRYVADMPSGLLQWSASSINENGSEIEFHRKALPESAEPVISAIHRAYRSLLRTETRLTGSRLVEFHRLRGTAAFMAGVSNDLVDRVVAGMVTGQLRNPYHLQPSSGAQWRIPPSERPLRIGTRRYTIVTFMGEPKEDQDA
jgi:hypothetical protein